MKVTIGMKVQGQCGSGEVVAMSKEWCIYAETVRGVTCELAEPWSDVSVLHDGPAKVVSSVSEAEVE